MPRSAEQQILVDELIKFLKKYKGESIDTEVLAKKVSDIWKGNFAGTAAKKLSDLRAANPEIFKDIKIEYKTRGQGDWNKAWENDPEFRKFFKKKRPGVVWDNLIVDQRDIKSNTYASYLYEKAKAKTIPKNYIPFQDFLKKIGVSENNFKEYRSNRKGTYGNLQKRVNDLFARKNFKKEVFYKDPSEKNINLFKKAIAENKSESISKMARTKASVSDPSILKIHEQLIDNPNAKPVELAKAIYKKTDADSLRKIGNDASRYSEVLTETRVIPGFKLPAKNLIDSILGNIFVAGNGFFKFGNDARRKAMLKERDKILNTKGTKFSTLRNALARYYRGSGLAIDEAMGMAATYKNAPGYTELIQRIPQNINLRKGNTIDKDFSKILQKITDGNEAAGSYRGQEFKNLKEHVKLFNKYSQNFQKEFKVDTPIIEYKPGEKLVTSNLIKNFDKLSPEAQINVTDLANRGIGLKSNAVPIAQMIQDTGDAALIKRYENRIGCAEGCLVKTANEQPSKFLKIYESISKVAKKGGRFGAIAAGGAVAAGLVKQFMNDDPSTYLSDENQQKNMLIDMITEPVLEPSMGPATTAFSDAQLPVLGATVAAGMVPGGAELYKQRIGSPNRQQGLGGPPKIPKARVSPFRAALGPISGVLGKGLAATGTPLGMAALEPLFIGHQIAQGDSPTEIATNPFNYLGATFASPLTKEATRFASPKIASLMRLGMSPTALRGLSRLGGYGLAASLGIQGLQKYDDWRNKRGWFSEE